MASQNRFFSFVLHSHLPYVVSHGKWPHGVDWLNEATAETYLPLIEAFDRMADADISARATLSVTPVLAEQLSDPSFLDEFDAYLEMKVEAAQTDEQYFHTTADAERERIAQWWQEWYGKLRADFSDRYQRDVVGQFRRLQDAGHIEIITCAATHGYLALLGRDECVRAQVRTGVETYEKHFGRRPRGIWLPECAYRPPYHWQPPVESPIEPYDRAGVDAIVSEFGIDYFILDTHLLRGGEAIGQYIDRFEALRTLWAQFEKAYPTADEAREIAPMRPYYTAGVKPEQKPTAFFARHPEASLQVWSGEWGYPGDPRYLDFHKKNFPGGHRYWAVTGRRVDLADKVLYNPDLTEARLEENADHFVDLIGKLFADEPTDEPAVICAPFDTELFGHWWFEGPRWIEKVLTKMAARTDYQPATGSNALEAVPPREMLEIPEGSWGEGGYHYIWLNEFTKWTWRHLYEDEQRYVKAAEKWAGARENNDLQRVLRQAGRELLLAESSDWQFLISTISARDYAELRFTHHHEVFVRLMDLVDRLGAGETLTDGDWLFVEGNEKRDPLFENLDPAAWLPKERHA